MAQNYDNSQIPSSEPDRKTRPQSYQAPTSSSPPPHPLSQESTRPRASSSLSPERRARQQQQQQQHKPVISHAVNPAPTQNHASTGGDPDLVARITQLEQVIESLKLSGVHSPPKPPPGQYSDDLALRNVITPPSPEIPIPAAPQYTSPSQAEAQLLDGSTDSPSISPPSPPQQEAAQANQIDGTSRPHGPTRAPTDDSTPLERNWRPLFDSRGNPTERLGQFLRGLAIHIIEDFEPQKSIVIPPQKMLKFYESVKLPEEIYPWKSLFGGTMTNSSLSHLYRDLMCEHHFVQFGLREKPAVPALTPAGFQTWMTYVIRSHPELEFQRFSKAVLNMPISNADDRKERFPKELSRRLFPREANMDLMYELEDAILADRVIELTAYGIEHQKTVGAAAASPAASPTKASQTLSSDGHKKSSVSPPLNSKDPPPPVIPEPTSNPIPIPLQPSINAHRRPAERNTFSSTSSETATDELHTSSSHIERQRKPYSAAPGGGKVYDDGDHLRELASEGSRQTRAHSSVTSGRPYIDSTSESDASLRYRTGSVPSNSGPPPPRQSSPSFNSANNYYNRSEAGFGAGSYGSNGPSLYPREIDDNYLRQTVSWNEYPRFDPIEYPPPPPRDYPLPPPPPRGYDDEPLRKHVSHPPPPPRY